MKNNLLKLLAALFTCATFTLTFMACNEKQSMGKPDTSESYIEQSTDIENSEEETNNAESKSPDEETSDTESENLSEEADSSDEDTIDTGSDSSDEEANDTASDSSSEESSDDNNGDIEQERIYSEGLEYTLGYDKTYYVLSGIGNCTDLDIIIPKQHNGLPVTGIGWNAFEGCSTLTNVTIPDSVTYIGESVFDECVTLTSITIPDSVTSIGARAFYGCVSLTSVYYEGDIAGWCNISGLTTLTENGVDLYINDKLIEGDLIIPNDITSIGDGAFAVCSNITSVILPDSVTSIGECVFAACVSLTTITIGNGATSIGESAFLGCVRLTSITMGNGVKSIGRSAFRSCVSLTSVTIGNSVTSIGNVAFRDCSSLTSVTIGSGVTSIGDSAFDGCNKLKNIIVSEENTSYKSIDGNLYSKDGTILIQYTKGKTEREFVIPDGVTNIGDEAFYDCSSLTSITIPDSVTSIGRYAFEGCDSLTSVTIGNGVTSIGARAFNKAGYYNDENNWENGVLYLDGWLLEAKSTLVSGEYSIKVGTKCIGDSAFEDCDSLTSITIPDSVTSIGRYAL